LATSAAATAVQHVFARRCAAHFQARRLRGGFRDAGGSVAGKFNLPLRHVLGPSAASPSEIASIAAKLGPGAIQLLVRDASQ